MYTSSLWSCVMLMSGAWQWHHRDVWMHSTSGAHTSVILKWTRELDSLRLQHSSSRDDSNCLAMLPKLAKLVTTVHCKHLSPASNWRGPRGRPRQTWLPTISDDLIHPNLGLRSAYVVLHGGRSCQQLCWHSGWATRWWWWPTIIPWRQGGW